MWIQCDISCRQGRASGHAVAVSVDCVIAATDARYARRIDYRPVAGRVPVQVAIHAALHGSVLGRLKRVCPGDQPVTGHVLEEPAGPSEPRRIVNLAESEAMSAVQDRVGAVL